VQQVLQVQLVQLRAVGAPDAPAAPAPRLFDLHPKYLYYLGLPFSLWGRE